jgi:hypothetical protein
MSPLNAAICTTISYTLWVEWYYLKNNYLTLRSKVKVPRRSLWYATHRLVVMHPHTKYHWPYQISLTYLEKQKCYGPDKKILFKKKKILNLKVKVTRRSLLSSSKIVSSSHALPPRWPPQCSCVVIESSFDPCQRLQAPGSLLFVFPDRSIIFGTWVHDHKAVCRIP